MSYQIGDLKFNVTVYDIDGKLHTFNIFDHVNVKRAICCYKLDKRKILADDLCLYFFGDFWSRCEFEMVLQSWPLSDRDTGYKIDIYNLFIKPNFPMLLEMINQTTATSCRQWRKVNGR